MTKKYLVTSDIFRGGVGLLNQKYHFDLLRDKLSMVVTPKSILLFMKITALIQLIILEVLFIFRSMFSYFH